jgi:alpha-galactosidase
MKERIVLVGAGSAMFTRGLVADLIRTGLDAELALVDVDPAALEVATKLSCCASSVRSRRCSTAT